MPTKYDTLLVTRPENIRYLSGFSGDGVLLLKLAKGKLSFDPSTSSGLRMTKSVLVTDPRYLLRAREEKKSSFRLTVTRDSFADTFAKTLANLKTKKLGFEAKHMTVANLTSLKKKTGKLKIKFLPTENVVEKQRRVKSSAEIRLIKKSCQLTVRVLREILQFLRLGQTELTVAEEIRRLAIKFGAEKLAFDPVVAFGASSACPHAKPSRKKLRQGAVVLLDLGVVYRGYCSDLTRTFFTAKPTKYQQAVYETVRIAQESALQKVRAGMKCREIDATARKTMKNQRDPLTARPATNRTHAQDDNFEKFFTHSLGHGVGIEIHEAPNLSAKSKDTLQIGNVVTVEPGIYLEKSGFGVRIEDTAVVTKKGAEILTMSPKQLTVLKLSKS